MSRGMLPENLANRAPAKWEEFYSYSTGRLSAISVGGTLTTNILIQADSDFVLEKLTYYADIAGAAQTASTKIVPNVSVMLTSTGSGQNLFSANIPIDSVFGSGGLPFILPFPRLFPANSTLQISLTSFEAAITPILTLNFHGRKRYRSTPVG